MVASNLFGSQENSSVETRCFILQAHLLLFESDKQQDQLGQLMRNRVLTCSVIMSCFELYLRETWGLLALSEGHSVTWLSSLPGDYNSYCNYSFCTLVWMLWYLQYNVKGLSYVVLETSHRGNPRKAGSEWKKRSCSSTDFTFVVIVWYSSSGVLCLIGPKNTQNVLR